MLRQRLLDLCALPGVSSHEDAVRDYILREAAYDRYEIDSMGNLFCFKTGKRPDKPPFVYCAHMDEVGLMVRYINDDGSLKFTTIGGIDRRVLLGQRVNIGENNVPGVIGVKAYHLLDEDEDKKVPKLRDLNIDIGCFSRHEAEKLVQPGDVCVFASVTLNPPTPTGCAGSSTLRGTSSLESSVTLAKAIDDRAGCAALIELMNDTPPTDTWFVFTVQEEVGTRGALTAVFGRGFTTALILEATTAADLPEIPEHRQVCKLGGGVAIPHRDRGTVYDLALDLQAVAEREGIPWQTKSLVAGGTDAAALQRSGVGLLVGGLAVPTRYLHSPTSVCDLRDVEAMLALARAYGEEYAHV